MTFLQEHFCHQGHISSLLLGGIWQQYMDRGCSAHHEHASCCSFTPFLCSCGQACGPQRRAAARWQRDRRGKATAGSGLRRGCHGIATAAGRTPRLAAAPWCAAALWQSRRIQAGDFGFEHLDIHLSLAAGAEPDMARPTVYSAGAGYMQPPSERESCRHDGPGASRSNLIACRVSSACRLAGPDNRRAGEIRLVGAAQQQAAHAAGRLRARRTLRTVSQGTCGKAFAIFDTNCTTRRKCYQHLKSRASQHKTAAHGRRILRMVSEGINGTTCSAV